MSDEMFEDEYIELAQGRAYWQARAEAAENDLRELRENTLLALGHNRPALEDIMKLQHPPNGHRLKQELAAAIARAESAERELAECKAAQEWRPGDEIPHEEGWYQTLNWGMYGHLYFSGGRWSRYPVPPALWRPVPPPPQGEAQ